MVIPNATLAQERVIRFGSDATYPPFEYTSPDGEILGFDIDLAKAICEKLKAKCTFQNQAWDGIIPALRAKKFDVIASSMAATPERRKAVDFTQKFWSIPSLLIGREGLKAAPTPEGTKGLDLALQQGTIQDKYASTYFKEANIRRYKSFEDAMKDLVTGRVQVAFATGGAIDKFLAGPHGKDFIVLGDPLPSSTDRKILGEGTGFAVRKGDKQLLDDLNRAFDAIRADGTFDKIAKKYFTYDVYN